MSCNDPDYHEDAEHDIAKGIVARIFEAFCGLSRMLDWQKRLGKLGYNTGKKRSTTSIMQRIKLATLVWW